MNEHISLMIHSLAWLLLKFISTSLVSIFEGTTEEEVQRTSEEWVEEEEEELAKHPDTVIKDGVLM